MSGVASTTSRSQSSPPARPRSITPRPQSSRNESCRPRSRQSRPSQCRSKTRSKSEHSTEDTELTMTSEPRQLHLTRELAELLPVCLGDIATHCPSDPVEGLAGRLYQCIGGRCGDSLERQARLDTLALSGTLAERRKTRAKELEEIREQFGGLQRMLRHTSGSLRQRQRKQTKEKLSFSEMMERYQKKRKDVILDQIRKTKDANKYKNKIRIVNKTKLKPIERKEGFDEMEEENEDDCYSSYYSKTEGTSETEIGEIQKEMSLSDAGVEMNVSQEEEEQPQDEDEDEDENLPEASLEQQDEQRYSNDIQSVDSGSTHGFGPGKYKETIKVKRSGKRHQKGSIGKRQRSSNINKEEKAIDRKSTSDKSDEKSGEMMESSRGSTSSSAGGSRESQTKESNHGGSSISISSNLGMPNQRIESVANGEVTPSMSDVKYLIPIMNDHEVILENLEIMLEKFKSRNNSLENALYEEMHDARLELKTQTLSVIRNSFAGMQKYNWVEKVREVIGKMAALEKRQIGKLKLVKQLSQEDIDKISKYEMAMFGVDLRTSYLKYRGEETTPQMTPNDTNETMKILTAKSRVLQAKRKYRETLKATKDFSLKAFKGAFGVYKHEDVDSILRECSVSPMLGHFSKKDSFVFECEIEYLPELYTVCSDPSQDEKSYDYWGVEPMSLEDYHIEDPLEKTTRRAVNLQWPHDTSNTIQWLKEEKLIHSAH